MVYLFGIGRNGTHMLFGYLRGQAQPGLDSCKYRTIRKFSGEPDSNTVVKTGASQPRLNSIKKYIIKTDFLPFYACALICTATFFCIFSISDVMSSSQLCDLWTGTLRAFVFGLSAALVHWYGNVQAKFGVVLLMYLWCIRVAVSTLAMAIAAPFSATTLVVADI